ncbi:branched-chain alpha-ketoacid dehydrogenase kinase-like [Convolutriloba macropyga]|uniref:branched-chain alpha-ketoacid dehydrogenase kinase-like n=1 Tax=Convolutriloba macropyga TaxID=536237 RepID=UPI003F528731
MLKRGIKSLACDQLYQSASRRLATVSRNQKETARRSSLPGLTKVNHLRFRSVDSGGNQDGNGHDSESVRALSVKDQENAFSISRRREEESSNPDSRPRNNSFIYHSRPQNMLVDASSSGSVKAFSQTSVDRLSHLYNQPEVDHYAARPSVRLTPSSMLYTGGSSDGLHLLKSSQYLQKELPVRVAHRIAGFRRLPFIVAINPILLSVHELYLRTFKLLIQSEPVKDSESEQRFCQFLRGVLNDHKDVVTMLASGFKDSSRYLNVDIPNETTNLYRSDAAMDMRDVRKFLDRMLTSRLGLRMLAEHHLGLHNHRENFVGIVQTDFSLKKLAHKWAEWCKRLCEHTYGVSPEIEVNGHLNVIFPYIPLPLDYILPELLKNALRATVELHRQKYNKGFRQQSIPNVVVTIANNETDFMLRISDRGGGVPSSVYSRIFHYNFSTVSDANGTQLFDTIVEESNHGTGPMHGYGFGLPTCKAYAEYLGGSLTVENMNGIGCDVYLKLPHIDSGMGSFRI